MGHVSTGSQFFRPILGGRGTVGYGEDAIVRSGNCRSGPPGIQQEHAGVQQIVVSRRGTRQSSAPRFQSMPRT